jgi:hypothetical protein
VKTASRNSSSSSQVAGRKLPPPSTGLMVLLGAPTPFQRWRERPRRWPRAWQANRLFRVVAHATGWCWRPLQQWRHQAGGIERRPRTTGCNLHDVLHLSHALAVRQSSSSTIAGVTTETSPGGTPRAEGVFPPVFPLASTPLDDPHFRSAGNLGNESGGRVPPA